METTQKSTPNLVCSLEPQASIFRFVLQPSCRSFLLYGPISESARLSDLLADRNLNKALLKTTLNQIEQPVKSLLNLVDATSPNRLMKIMKVSCLLLLVYLVMTMIDAYYDKTESLISASVWVGAIGLTLQGILVVGSLRKVKPKADIGKKRETLTAAVTKAISEANDDYQSKGLSWEIESGTLTLTLRDELGLVNQSFCLSQPASLTAPISHIEVNSPSAFSESDIKSSKQFKAMQLMLESKNDLIRTLRTELNRLRRGMSSDSSVVIG